MKRLNALAALVALGSACFLIWFVVARPDLPVRDFSSPDFARQIKTLDTVYETFAKGNLAPIEYLHLLVQSGKSVELLTIKKDPDRMLIHLDAICKDLGYEKHE